MFDKSGFLIGGGYVDKLRVIRKRRGFSKDSLKSVLSDSLLHGSISYI